MTSLRWYYPDQVVRVSSQSERPSWLSDTPSQRAIMGLIGQKGQEAIAYSGFNSSEFIRLPARE